MSAAEDVARMLTLVPWLLERPGASVAETAAAFGVDERTIRRDLGHLDFCGLPGLGGGDLFEVEIVADRIVLRMAEELRRPLRPTPREALRLVLTLDAVAEALGDELPALRAAVDKVRRGLGIPETVADVVEPTAGDAVTAVRGALRQRRRVRLLYQGRGDDRPQPREVEPWALHVRDGVWYLQGHDLGVGAHRTFRLDRAAEVEVTDAPRTTEPPDDLPPPRYVPGPDDVEVRLRLAPPAVWILDAVEAERTETVDGTTWVTFRTDTPDWVARLVLMAGGGAAVAAPDELRSRVAELARSALHPYRDD